MKIIFFKIIYIIRKKIQHIIHWYLVSEITLIHNNRITIGDNVYFTDFPSFHFDQSGSNIKLGNNVSLRGRINFSFCENGSIEIGEYTFLNAGCSINSLEHIKIGANCLFGENVKLYDHNHAYSNENNIPIKDQGYTTAPIEIGNNCWIGSDVTVLKGVVIGDNCVIGAGSLVIKSIPSGSIMYADISNQIIKKSKIV